MAQIIINNNLKIDENEISYSFVHASGPGGQNVNKVATAVQLRFNVIENTSIDDEVKTRLKKLAGKKLADSGILIIEAKRFRSQEKKQTRCKR